MVSEKSSGYITLNKVKNSDNETGIVRFAYSKTRGYMLVTFLGELKEEMMYHMPCYLYLAPVMGKEVIVNNRKKYAIDIDFFQTFAMQMIQYSLSRQFDYSNIIFSRDLKLLEAYDKIDIRNDVRCWLTKNKLSGLDFVEDVPKEKYTPVQEKDLVKGRIYKFEGNSAYVYIGKYKGDFVFCYLQPNTLAFDFGIEVSKIIREDRFERRKKLGKVFDLESYNMFKPYQNSLVGMI